MKTTINRAKLICNLILSIGLLSWMVLAGGMRFLGFKPAEAAKTTASQRLNRNAAAAFQLHSIGLEPASARSQAQSLQQALALTSREATGGQTSDGLMAKAQADGAVRVIVGLRAAFQPEGTLNSLAEVQAQHLTIAQAQNGLLSQMAGFNVTSVKQFPSIPFLAMEVDAAGLQFLASSPDVTTVHEDKINSLTLAESVPLIGATAAWASGFTGAGQTVAILDTGVDKAHPFLAGKVVSEACYSTTSSAAGTSSVCPGGVSNSTATGSGVNCTAAGCEHGTHVAGIAAGKGSSFSGVAKDANVIAIQVFSKLNTCPSSPNPCVGAFDSDIILGLQRVQALSSSFNIAAVNLSLGGGNFSSNCDSSQASFKTAVDNLRSLGIATVVASGNDGSTTGISTPACISTAISVGSTGDGSNGAAQDVVSSFSNSAPFLNLLAPGQWINSSVPGGGFAIFAGTSMSAPHVTGAWAVLKSKSPNATVSQILSALTGTGLPVTDTRNSLIKPRIKVDAAVNALASTSCSLALSSTTQSFTAALGTGTVNVTAGSGCTWTASSNNSWINVTSGSSGSGNGTVNYSVAANTGAARTGTLFIAGQTSIVIQAANPQTVTLAVDDGSIEIVIGLINGGTAIGLNRLTPSSYPATLNAVSIFLPSGAGISQGQALTVLAGANPSGSSNINGISLQSTSATIQSLEQFNVFTVPSITITSGDFVVGMQITHAAGARPFASDTSSARQRRSYLLTSTSTYTIIDDLGLGSNLMMRALVTLEPGTCPTVTGINPSSGGIGSSVTITGTNLTGVTGVKFSSNVTATFTVVNDSTITATVPSGAVTGPITISKTGCPDAQTASFTVTQPCPTITLAPATLPNGTVGTAYTQTITASGGTPPYNFTLSAGTLPSGLTLSSAGVLSGTPTQGGSFNLTIKATDANNCTGTQSYTLVINCPVITLSPTTLPGGAVNTAYNQTITALPAGSSYTFALTAGALPAGLSLNSSTGAITGTPTTAGTANFTITATGFGTCTGSQAYAITIQLGVTCPAINSLNPTSGPVGTQVTITGTNFIGLSSVRFSNNVAASFTVVNNTTITATVPSGAATGPITISKTGCADAQTVGFTVTCPAITIAPASLPNGTVGTAYTQTLTASGSTPPFGFAVTAGTLPGGLTLSPGGALSGTPTAAGTFNFTITAINANNCAGARSYTVNIAGASGTQNSFLYVLDANVSGSLIYGFAVNETTGALTLLSGFPVLTGGTGRDDFADSELLAIDRLNQRLYAVDTGSNTLSAFSINPTTGALTPLPFSPINLGAGNWTTVAVHPSGSPLVVGDGNPNNSRVSSYRITATTATQAPGSPYILDNASPFSSVFSQDGNYFYAGGNVGNNFAGFSVNAATGALTPLANSPFNSGNPNTAGYATDATGRLFMTNVFVGQLRVFTTTNGIPSTVASNPFTSGLTQGIAGLLHPNGFYLVADRVGNRVGVYRISGSGVNTSLAPVNGSPFATGDGLTDALALNQAGTFLYVANGDTRSITTFSLNPTTGGLLQLNLPPVILAAGRLSGIVYLSPPAQCPTITLSPNTLPNGTLGTPYNQTISASPSGSYTFTVTAGSLPAALSLNSATGAITGTPTATGTASFIITATGSGNCTGSQSYSITIQSPCPTFTSLNPTSGAVGNQVTINGAGFTGVSSVRFSNNVAATFTVVNDTTIIATVPSGAVSGPITISKTGCNDVQSTSFTITCPTITISPASLPDGTGGTAYSQTLTASGGAAPFSFAVTTGALPGGLTLSTGGVLSGTPNVAGTFNFTVTATDANGCTGTRNYTVNITVTLGAQTRVLYVLNDNAGGNQIYGYAVNEATGALTLLAGFPISTGGNGNGLTVSEQLAIDRTNQRLYAINGGSNTVSAYAINPTTGALTPLPFSPISLGSGFWDTIAVHPSGSPLVVGDSGGPSNLSRLLSYQITAATATTAVGSPYSTGTARPFSAAFSQDGNYIYTGGNTEVDRTIAGFSVNAATGVLTALAGSPFDFGVAAPSAYATDAAGRLFTARKTEVRAFTTLNGIPSAVSGNPFPSGLTGGVHGLLHPNGFYLVADHGDFGSSPSNRVGVYRINGSGSGTTLAAVAGSPFTAGGSFTDVLALNQTGTFLFAANGDSRNLTTFSVNPTTGTLTSLGTQPTNTLGTSGRLTGMSYLSTPCSTITVSPATLPNGTVNTAYNQTVSASPSGSYTFTVTAGLLPAGLSLNSTTGAITGTPTTAGTSNFTITALSFGPCSGSQAYSITINNPPPTIASLSPTSATVGGAAFTLTVNGTNFINGSVVRWNGSNRTTTFVSSTRLTAAIPATDLTTAGTANVTVSNPAPGSETSDAVSFAINNPAPSISSLIPSSATAGRPGLSLLVSGSNFINGSVVKWNGSDRVTRFSSSSGLFADITEADLATPGTANVTVFNPAPGGGLSSAATFRITDPVPTITDLSPHTVTTGGPAFTLTVTGFNFNAQSKVLFNNSERPTTFVNSKQLTAAISDADIAAGGAANIAVANPPASGGTSGNANLLVNDLNLLAVDNGQVSGCAGRLVVPFIKALYNRLTPKFYPATLSEVLIGSQSISGNSVPVEILIGVNPSGGEDINGVSFQSIFTSTNSRNGLTTFPVPHITINSGDFVIGFRGDVYCFGGGIPDRGRSYVSQDGVTIQRDTGNALIRARLTQPCVAITNLSPTSGSPGATVTITGTNFTGVTAVKFANNITAQFTVVNDTTITTTVPNGAATGPITVSKQGCTEAPTGTFTFIPPNPVPTLSSLNPNFAIAGGAAFTLTVNGTNFINGSVVRWNGSNRATTFVSSTRLTAAITAADIAAVGTASVTIFNPAPGGGASTAQTFFIDPSPTLERVVRVGSASAAPGSTVNVPLELVAYGNENALGFSLTFDPAILSNPQASLGADASGATLNFNSSQAAQGRLGLALSLPTGQNFAAGTRQILNISFTVAASAAATSTPVGFSDQPIARELVDRNANSVTVSFSPGTVTITAAQGYEADVAPRPNGSNNGAITVADWAQVGRFAAGVDTAANGSEFQRADCAPRETLGDGRITTADWVQAGRYAAGMDPVTAIGGPTAPVPSAQAVNAAANAATLTEAAITRGLRVGTSRCELGRDCTLIIELDARGGENAAGLSLNFDPSQLRFQAASAGRDISGAVLHLNTSQITRGSLGLALALPAGQSLPVGTLQLVTLTFTRLDADQSRAIALGFADQPVARELVDVNARALPASYALSDGLTSIRAAAHVSAASFSGAELASEALASAFGTGLATATQAAETFPLPLTLSGTQVTVRDSAGIERPALLFFVSPTQVNYQIPPGTAPGSATVTIRSGDGVVSMGMVEIARVAPGLFTANASGQGAAAAIAVRVASDGGQSFEPVAVFDPAQSKYVSRSIDLGSESEQVVLLLFGTGLRHRGSLANVTASIGGVQAEVDYAGPQLDFIGLDQLNVRVPRSLIGRGEVDLVLTVEGQTANLVKVNFK